MDDNDLIDVEVQGEEHLLHILKSRYKRRKYHTSIGSILVSFNPTLLPSVKCEEVSQDGSKKPDTCPRPETVATSMYSSLCQSGESQCCIVTGETGSGKTDVIKDVLDHVLNICKLEDSNLIKKVKIADDVFDAFGHAKTPLSDNSTRFGKLLQLYSTQDGRVFSASISKYILDKARVTRQRKDERNFHVFYYLFAGLSEDDSKKLLLGSPDQHRYLNFGAHFDDDKESSLWREKYIKLLESLKAVGFSLQDIEDIFRILSAILNVGNLRFANKDDSNSLYLNTPEALESAAKLLGVESQELENALIVVMTDSGGESLSAAKSIAKASYGRDLFGKELYSRLFSWLSYKINAFLRCPDHKKRISKCPSLCFLDMFGFESLEQNLFEQLCVNVANEQLQFYFTQYVFAWEQLECEQEGIELTFCEYTDNRNVVNLLLEKPSGLFALLDEESKCQNANDDTLVSKFKANCIDHSHYITVNSKRPMFGISHFAGKVVYYADGFLEKNKAQLSTNIIDCLKGSGNNLVSSLFHATISKTGSLVMEQSSEQTLPKADSKDDDRKNTNRRSRKGSDAAATSTRRKQKGPFSTGTQFRNSLVELMERVLKSKPHFIRCLKPCNTRESDDFDDELVLKQIKYFGLLETLRWRQQGYPVRLPCKQFLERYKIVRFSMIANTSVTPDNCEEVLQKTGITDSMIGSNHVFLKSSHVEILNKAVEKVKKDVITVQKVFRGKIARIEFDYLLSNKKYEERTIGNFLMSISSKSAKVHETLGTMNNQDLKRYEKQREDTRRKPKEYQKKKVAKTTSDPSNQFRRQRSKDDSNIPKRQLSYGSPAHKSQPFRGEFPLTRDFTRGRMKAWCRLDCFERQYHVASFFLHQSVITIDGSNLVDESARIGLGYIPSKTQDPKVTKVKNCIGKGVKLHQDDGGNMWATRMGKNPIYLRGFFLSPELIKLNGKLTQGVPMKVFDVQDFKKNLLQECSRESLSEDDKNKIMGTCKICVSFIKDTMVDEETPCWVEVWLVEHIDTVRRKFMDVERLRRKKLSAEKRLPRGSTPRFENVSNARYELKAKDTIPEEPSEKRVPLTEVPPQTAIPKKVVSPPPPLDLSQNDELPLAENEIRLVMRSPHIRVSGEKDYKDYGGNLPYMSRDQYMAEQQQQPLSDYQRQFVVQEQEPSLSEYAHPLFSQEAQYFPMGNEEERVPQYGKSEGLSYGRVFGMQAFDYAFDFVPPKYTRHRRHSDSDSESVRNFMEANMPIHGILELEEKKPMATPLQWISKKTRRKSEDQKRKGLPPR